MKNSTIETKTKKKNQIIKIYTHESYLKNNNNNKMQNPKKK